MPGLFITLLTQIAWGKEYEPLNYFGISFLQLSESKNGPDFRPDGMLFRLGFMGGEHFGLELQTALTQTGGDFELRNATGMYLHAALPHQRLTLFTLAGMARVDLKNAGNSETSENFSFGFGIRWRATKTTDIGMEWMNYGERPTYKADSLNIGFVKHF